MELLLFFIVMINCIGNGVSYFVIGGNLGLECVVIKIVVVSLMCSVIDILNVY